MARTGWQWCAIGCFATLVAGCSGQNVPTSSSALGLHNEVGLSHAAHSDASPNAASDLAAVRAVTAKYHNVSAALADQYQLGYLGAVTGCVSNPAGAMGYHYFNKEKMEDPAIIATDPEVLVYHTGDDGRLELGAVEWVVPKPLWDQQPGNSAAPVVFGTLLHVLNPVLNWYVAHAWIWTHNPAGMFADWNPDVHCP